MSFSKTSALLGLALFLFLLQSCGKKEEAIAQAAPAPQEQPPGEGEVPVTDPAPAPQPKPGPKPGPRPQPPQSQLDQAIAWGIHRASWTNTVRAIVKARFHHFDRASDKESFCPGYSRASRAEKENCFVAVVAAIAKFECNFRPGLAFKEPDGNYSVGLLMLSKGECPNAPTIDSLKNPIQNLICGTNKMASLIARDGYLSGPSHKYGAAAYWSTLRNPYRRGKYKLGKKPLIMAITKGFRGSPKKKAVELLSMLDQAEYPAYHRHYEQEVMQMLREEDRRALEGQSGY